MELSGVWFAFVAVLWIGFLALEGFDFGVGMLMRGLARDESERSSLATTIGPVWAGNEVWLVAAVGATFAAFPDWYATVWSAYALPLVLILLALVGRGVALEYRAKGDGERWRRRCDAAIVVGSMAPAFGWGVVLTGFAQGLPLDSHHDVAGAITGLLTPYTLLGGAATLGLSLLLGCVYVALKTTGDLRLRAGQLAGHAVIPAGLLAATSLGWTLLRRHDESSLPWLSAGFAVVAALGLLASQRANRRGREGLAFSAAFCSMACFGAALFAALYPDVVPSTLAGGAGLTAAAAASSDYTLTVLTWVAVPLLPVVVAYQGWVYWAFRQRVIVQRLP